MFALFRRKPKFYTWTNPDGTVGGDVSEAATVDPGAVIERFAIVLSGSTLGPTAHIKGGDIVESGRITRFGPPISTNRIRFLKAPSR